MNKIRKIVISFFLFFSIINIPTPIIGANDNISATSPDNNLYFSKIYVDGFGANSNGFKLVLRTYERHLETQFKPVLVDIDYILMIGDKIIYEERDEQIPLSIDGLGETVLNHQYQVALEEGKNYTGIAKIYLYNNGVPEYYLTVVSNFTARNDADITDVYADNTGASATIKSKSMVPLDARIVFTLKKGETIIETKEIAAPYIISNDKEKTVSVLWTNNLNEGEYMLSVLLDGKDIHINYDKTLTVEKNAFNATPETTQSVNGSPSTPSFTAIMAIFALLLISRLRS